MQGLGGQQFLFALWQKRAVGGEDDTKVQFSGDGQKLAQFRVQQRLSHQVKIEKAGMAPELFGQLAEVLFAQKAPLPLGSGTKGAAEIAHIGDLQIHFFQHVRRLLLVYFR